MPDKLKVDIITGDGAPVSRDDHYKNMNIVIKGIPDYWELSREEQNERFKSSLHRPWEITYDIFMEFLEMFPPVAYTGDSFYMSEASHGNARMHYFKKDGKYYAEEATFPPGSKFVG